jgi:outer membrane protein assembly factor BamB
MKKVVVWRGTRRHPGVVVIGVAAVLLAAGPGAAPGRGAPAAKLDGTEMPAPAASWAQDGFGAENTSYNPAETIINATTIAKVTRRWRITVPAIPPPDCSLTQAPVVAGGRVFLAGNSGVAAHRVSDGRQLWRWRLSIHAPTAAARLAVAGNSLIVGTIECGSVSDPRGDLRVFDATTGALRWSREDFLPSRVVVDRGLIVVSHSGYAAGRDARVSVLRIADGTPVWSREGVSNGSVSAGGRLMLSEYDAGTIGVSMRTGALLWRRTERFERVVSANPAGDRFYSVDYDQVLRAVDARTGTTVWSRAGVDAFGSGNVATDGRRVFIATGTTLTAYRAGTGVPSWHATFSAGVGRPIRAGGLVYAVVGSGLTIRHAATGAEATGGGAYRGLSDHPVVVDGRLYLRQPDALTVYRP